MNRVFYVEVEYMNYYRVTCDTKKNGIAHWVMDIRAKTAKDARIKFDELWDKAAHPFHINIRKIKDDEEILYNWFTCLTLCK